MSTAPLRPLAVLLFLSLGGCACTPECAPGQLDCQCRSGNQCDDGVCTDGKCAAAPRIGVVVSDANARGCEVLLTESAGHTIGRAEFSSGVVGASLRQAPQVALSFVAPADAPLPSGGVQLTFTSGSSSGVTVTRATCVDARGVRLPDATVTLR